MKKLIFLVLILFAAELCSAATIHVPSQQPTIQAGINAAVDGDTVLVASGTFMGSGNRDIDFGGKRVVLKSENGASTTVINCGGSVSSPHRGFYFHSGEDSTAIVDGFTVTGGYKLGGGVYCTAASPTFKNCVIIANATPDYGGGAFVGENSSATFIGCSFLSNAAIHGAGFLCVSGGSQRLEMCLFAKNSAQGWGGRVFHPERMHAHCIKLHLLR